VIVELTIAALVASGSVVSPAPSPGVSGTTTWNGLTIGAPSAALRTVIGDPLQLDGGGSLRSARYLIPGTNSSYFMVIERSGRIDGFAAFTVPDGSLEAAPPDPSGVHIGDSLESVKVKHPDFQLKRDDDGNAVLVGMANGNRISYQITNGTVTNFIWTDPIDHGLPALTGIADPSGDSFANAILDVQSGESEGVSWEYRYLTAHRCAADDRWKLQQQSLLQHEGRAYDRLHVICPSTKTERDFYFDITPYFGKH
jgi:hypothetical protein